MPRALIIGASSGIGADIARLLAARGYECLLVARREDRLRSLADEIGNARILTADLLDRGAIAAVAERAGAVDVLVNNAGFGCYGPFQDTPLDRELDMVQVNIAAPLAITKLLLPAMVAVRRGRILNVASTAAFQPGPLMAVYYASKAFVLSFSEALAVELEGTGVTVTCLCPGPTRTEFVEHAGMDESGLFHNMAVMDSRTVAQAGVDGMMAGKDIVIPGWKNRLVAESTRLAPRKLAAKLARRVQESRGSK